MIDRIIANLHDIEDARVSSLALLVKYLRILPCLYMEF